MGEKENKKGEEMKKIILISLCLLLVSGCSWRSQLDEFMGKVDDLQDDMEVISGLVDETQTAVDPIAGEIEEIVEQIEEILASWGLQMDSVDPVFFPSIYFDFDSATLSVDAQKALAEVAKVANHYNRELIVVGYASSVGGEDWNLSLSMERAEAVQTYLVEQGVSVYATFQGERGEGFLNRMVTIQ